MLLYSLLLNSVHDFSGKVIENPPKDISYQFALLANLIRLVDSTYEILRSGLYVGAAALIRQSLEMNARLAEIQGSTNWSDGKTPNVSNLPLGVARLYGELSDISHFSKQEIGTISEVEISDGIKAQSICPAVDNAVLSSLMNQHIACLVITCFHQLRFLEGIYNTDVGEYVRYFDAAMQLLVEEGVIG